MAYNSNKGTQHSGDIQYEGDPNDTQIDFENDLVALKTNGVQRLIVSSSAITSSVVFSGSYDIYGRTFHGFSITSSTGITGSSLRMGAYGLTNAGQLAISSFNANWTNAGRTIANLGSVTTADINGGTLDNVVIGGATQNSAKFTTMSASSTAICVGLSSSTGITGSSLRMGAYGLTNAGQLAISSFNANWTNAGRTIANLGSVTTADINGGTLDNVVIGGATQNSAKVTTLNATNDVQVATTLGVTGSSTFGGLAFAYGGLDVQVASNPVAQFIHPSDNSTGAVINLINSKAGNAGDADDFCGGVVFKSKDSTSAATQYGKISTKIGDPTNTSEDGYMLFEVTTAGTPTTTYLRLDGLQSAITASQHTLINANLSTTGITHLSGSVKYPVVVKTASYALTTADSIIIFNHGSVTTGTLPTIIAGMEGTILTVKNIGSAAVRVVGSTDPAQNIDGVAGGVALSQGDCIQVVAFQWDWATIHLYDAS